MKRLKFLRNYFWGVVGIALFLFVLVTISVIGVTAWSLTTLFRLVAAIGLNRQQRELYLRACRFMTIRSDRRDTRFLGGLMWLPGDHGPYRPREFEDLLEQRQQLRYRLLSEIRRGGVAAWRIRLARCVY